MSAMSACPPPPPPPRLQPRHLSSSSSSPSFTGAVNPEDAPGDCDLADKAYTSLPLLLKSCAKSAAITPGKQLHAMSFKLNLSADLFVQTSLISMYSSCSHLDSALQVFGQMPVHNTVSFTAAVDACLRASQPTTAIEIFLRMLESGIYPDAFSFVSFLSVCGCIGALNLGRSAHAQIIKYNLDLTVFLGTSLIDMYCKNGNLEDAVEVFRNVPENSKMVQIWNSMIHGFAMNGLGREAIQLFKEMKVQPNELTFVAVLTGCAHAGLVEEGKLYFTLMRNKYQIIPSVKHYGCMVDLFSRSARLQEAFEFITHEMHLKPNYVIWSSLLSGCRLHGDLSLAEKVMNEISKDHFRPVEDTSHYVMMSNLYRNHGMLDKLQRMRSKVGRKPKGSSWIEVGGVVYNFGVSWINHGLGWSAIQDMLDELEVKLLRKGRDETMKNPHSERVAVAFGLINTSSPTAIRVYKNLRICGSCHSFMKLVSDVYGREILIRDCNRFHRFVGGECSCNDYW